MVELRYLKEEINAGDGIDYEGEILKKLQYRNIIRWGNSDVIKWSEWQDVPTEWVNTEITKID